MISSRFHNCCTLEISFLKQVPTSMARPTEHFKLSVPLKLYVNFYVIVHFYFLGLVGELRLCFSYEYLIERFQCRNTAKAEMKIH